MRILVQIIQNYLTQSKACVMVTIEEQKGMKYYFNIPDGTQRYAKEHGMSFSKSSRIFLTSMSPNHQNGLLGLLCTMSAQDRSEDTCLFGVGITEFLESTRYLLQLNMNLISTYDFQTKQKLLGFQSSKDLVKHFVENTEYAPWMQYNFNEWTKSKGIKTNDASRLIDDKNNYKDEFVNIQPIVLQGITERRQSVCYIIRTKAIQGKVIKERLTELGVPAKQTGELLKNGKIVLPNGKIVLAEEVKEDDIPPQVIIIVDLDNEVQLKEFIARDEIKQIIEMKQQIGCLVSMVRQDIINSVMYQQEILEKLQITHHLIVNDEGKQAVLDQDRVALEQVQLIRTSITNNLHKYSPANFPNLTKQTILDRFQKKEEVLKEIDTTTEEESKKEESDSISDKKKDIKEYVGCPLKECVVYPFKNSGYGISKQVQQRLANKSDEMKVLTEGIEKLSIKEGYLKEDISSTSSISGTSNGSITFLGTGSMLPTPTRTVSCVLIDRESSMNNILLDCGEGSYAQILGQFGVVQGEKIIVNTRLLFISHVHLDHCLGLFYFLFMRDKIIEKLKGSSDSSDNDIYVIVPFNVAPLIRSFDKHCYSFAKHNKFIFANNLTHGELQEKKESLSEEKGEEVIEDFSDFSVSVKEGDKLLDHYEHPLERQIVENYFSQHKGNTKQLISVLQSQLKMKSLQLCQVIHCAQSFGIAIECCSDSSDCSSEKSKLPFKISYSGDTRPCSEFEVISQNSDVFIHECTFSDDLQKNAEENNHSTLTEAINSCKKSNSKQLVLTHFSQRYSLIDVDQFKGDKQFLADHTIVAFDHLTASFEEFMKVNWLSKITQGAQGLLQGSGGE